MPKPVGGEVINRIVDRDAYIRKNMPAAYLERHEQELQLLELESRNLLTPMDNPMKVFYSFEHVLKFAGPALQYACQAS